VGGDVETLSRLNYLRLLDLGWAEKVGRCPRGNDISIPQISVDIDFEKRSGEQEEKPKEEGEP